MSSAATPERAPKALFLAFGLLAIGIVASGYLYYRQYEAKYRVQVESQLSAVADLKVHDLANWWSGRLADGEVFRSNPVFSALVSRTLTSPQDAEAERLLRTWLSQVRVAYGYDRLILLDDRGVARIAVPGTPEPASPHLARDAAAVLRSGQKAFLDFHRDAPGGTIYLAVLAPIRSPLRGGRPLGVLVLRINPATYLYPSIQRWPVPSPTSEILIVRRDGNDVLYLNALRFRPDAALNLRFPLTNTERPAVRAVLGREGITEGSDYRGKPVLAALRAVPDSPWFVVAKTDVSEAYAPLTQRLWAMVVLVAALVAGAGAAIGWLWRRRSTQFYRKQYEGQRELGRAEEAVRASEERLRRIHDSGLFGVIYWTMDGRITDANDKFLNLVGYTREELAAGQVDWIHMTPPEFRSLDDASVAELNATGVNSAPIEKEYIRKDGTRLPVLVAGAMLDEKRFDGVAVVVDISQRKRAEEALRQSEARYRTLVENIPQKVFVKDRQSRFVSINENFARDLGIRPEEVVGKTDYDLFPKELADKYRADDTRVMETGKGEELEERYLQEDRDTWVQTRKTPMRNADGEIVGVCGVFADITERKLAAEALRASEERFRVAAGSVADVVYEWDLKDTLTWFGDVDGLMGYPAGGFPRTLGGWVATLHPEDTPRVSAAIEAQLRGAAPYDVEYRVAAKDGAWRWWSARGTALRNDRGEAQRWIGAITDVTARKRAEEALRESERRLRELAESLPQLVWTCRGDDGTCDYLSPQWVAYTGIPEAEQLGFRWLEQLHPADREPTVTAWNAAAGSGSVFDVEFRIRRNDGIHRWFKTRGLPMRGDEGLVVRWFGTCTDIDDQKRAEEVARQALADLTRSNKELEQFAYVASHDLQEPLRMVSSYTQLLGQRYEGQLDEKAKKYIDYAVDGAVRMQRLINDLLSYSRIGTRGKPLEPTDAHAVLGEAVANLAAAIEESGALVTNDDLPTVRTDPTQLVQVFQNLLANAIKFRGGEPPRVHVSARDEGREWVFTIRDNGIGIEPQFADRVFVIFQRLHTRQEYPGTGIGLALSKRIVERHGGRIWFESEPGKGTTFFFTVPK